MYCTVEELTRAMPVRYPSIFRGRANVRDIRRAGCLYADETRRIGALELARLPGRSA